MPIQKRFARHERDRIEVQHDDGNCSRNSSSLIPIMRRRFFRCWTAVSLMAIRNYFRTCAIMLIPEIMVRESQALVERLAEMTRNGHRKFANTVFHLEPNVKDGPGGYQDYVMARWLALHVRHGKASAAGPTRKHIFLPANQSAMDSALAFFASVRCFLHFRNKRDDDLLTWDAQDAAAAQKMGAQERRGSRNASDWMRIYFGHARAVDHISGQLLEEMPAAQSLFYRQLETWRTGFSDEDFSVVDGLIFFQKPENLSDPGLSFRDISLDRPARLQTQSNGRTPARTGKTAVGRPPSIGRRNLGVSGGMFCRNCMLRMRCARCTPSTC